MLGMLGHKYVVVQLFGMLIKIKIKIKKGLNISPHYTLLWRLWPSRELLLHSLNKYQNFMQIILSLVSFSCMKEYLTCLGS